MWARSEYDIILGVILSVDKTDAQSNNMHTALYDCFNGVSVSSIKKGEVILRRLRNRFSKC